MNPNFGQDYDFLDDEERELVTRYEEMLTSNASTYFDMAELEIIIDYYSERYELRKAMNAVALAEKLHAQSPALQLSKAVIYAFDGKPRRALKLIAQLEQSPLDMREINTFRLQLTKLYAVLMLDKLAEGMEIQDHLIRTEVEFEGDVEHILSIATSALFMKNRVREALQNLLSFEDKTTLSAYLLCHIAFAYAELGDVANAVVYYRKAIAQDAFDPYIWCDLADLLTDVGEAESAYDYALALDDKFVDAYCGKADLHFEHGQKKEAIELLHRAIEICGFNIELYNLLAEFHADCGDFEVALGYYFDIVKQDPFYPEVWFGIANAYIELNMNKDALDACEKALLLEEEPTSEECGLAAAIYLANGMKKKEQEMLEKMNAQMEDGSA